ncbi:MAG: DNA polymerase I [Parachlamydiaceae bacterium]|nr:DNA polymerase I [Parachlamydiaceae bacterium]
MKILFVLDASGYIYRSYFAIRNMTNSKGESTNALFGFIRSLQKLRKDFNPEHLVAVFDGPNGIKQRKAIYPEYKAHRSETPQDLRYQIEWARRACELMGIPYLSVPEVEADDTMGSVAVWAEKQEAHVYLCTSDKDLYQFVNDRVQILNTFKENQILGPKEVEEAFGVPPEQMIDLLAIMGDSSDNVPGVPGLGPKTAAVMLKEHGSLQKMLEHPELLTGKKHDLMKQYADQARLSRQLVTIHTDVGFEKDRSFFALRPPANPEALKEFYTSMNFFSLIKEMETQAPTIAEQKLCESVVAQQQYTLVEEEQAFHDLIKQLSSCKEVALSTIADGTRPLDSVFVGIAFCAGEGKAFYVPANGKLATNVLIAGLKSLFASPTEFYGHNIKYDIQILSSLGIQISQVNFDTILASYLLNSHNRQHDLDHLVLERFGKSRNTLVALLGKGKSAIRLQDAPPSHMSSYFCEAVDYIHRLKELLEKELNRRQLMGLLKELELPLVLVLAGMERHGIYVNPDYLKKMSTEIFRQTSILTESLYEMAGERFNLNSTQQLGQILFTKMGIKPPKKTATGLSTNAEVLESLQQQYPIAGKILEYRTLEKLRSTYVDSLPFEINPKTHRIHCTFNQTVAATGRLSCQDPNLQNIPIRSEIGRTIRGAFCPQRADWSYLAADYSQIELRLLAHLSGDPLLIEAFQKGEDIHTSTAAYIFQVPLDQVTKAQRYNAKAVNFGIVYGQQAFGLAQELGVDIKEAAAFIETYFQRYKRVKEYLEENKELTRQTGKAVTYTGRERLIPEIHSKNGQIRVAAERLAINTPLQGTAADLIKMAMLEVDKKLHEGQHEGYMMLQIHDELIFEIPDREIPAMETLVRKAMQEVMQLKVPLVVDVVVGKNWAEC